MERTEALLTKLRGCGSLAVALSGGVDSAMLAKAAFLALGDKAVAVTAVSEMVPLSEREDASACTGLIGIRHVLLQSDDLALPEVVSNGKERCYYCKKHRFQMLLEWAKAHGYRYVADGSNADDAEDYRPGMRAVRELKIISPLAECGFTKADIRRQAKEWGIPVWDKPSAACLASRVAYGIPLSPARLSRIDRAEGFLRAYLRGQIRVRDHGDLARLELSPAEFDTFWAHREELTERIKALGFAYVTLDLNGYRMGSQNEVL